MRGKMLTYDERLRIVDAYKRLHNAPEIAKVFGVAESTVYRLAAQERDTGDLKLHTNQRGRKRKLTSAQLDQVKEKIEERPDIALVDIIKELALPISESRLSRIVRQMGFRVKKKVMRASEQKRPRCRKEARRMG